MVAVVSFFGGEEYPIYHTANSGLGFFGNGGFGYSVRVGEHQDTTYITDTNGTVQGAAIDNCKYILDTGVEVNRDTVIRELQDIPNDKATIHVRFVYDEAVSVQNAQIVAYDGVSTANRPSGVDIYAFEVCNTGTAFGGETGYGDDTWVGLSGTSSYLELSDSPGSGGLYSGSGDTGESAQHDWYVALSSSPETVGSKTGKIMFSMEYL
jgi:hypothetical protein